MLEIKYENEYGEILTLRAVGNYITFNHTDIHEDNNKFEPIDLINQYFFNNEERKVITKFMELTKSLKFV
jgi:hypothetical protein